MNMLFETKTTKDINSKANGLPVALLIGSSADFSTLPFDGSDSLLPFSCSIFIENVVELLL